MSKIKSLSVGNGDMFYIRHGSDNFTIIDCCMTEDNRENIVAELKAERANRSIIRFISTHPDQDHIRGLRFLDDKMQLLNFYCVDNEATKEDETEDFVRYCELRDHERRAFHLGKGCSRLWMNKADEKRGSSGINILWPVLDNHDFQQALDAARDGNSPNNISPIVKYSLNNGINAIWMGDLETEFMETVEDDIDLPDDIHVLFAPHHGRKSGRPPVSWLEAMAPDIIVVGEAPASDLEYYDGYNTITQNSAGDIVFDCVTGAIHVYVASSTYSVDFLEDKKKPDADGHYIGTLST